MGTIGAIATVVGVGLEMLKSHIDDPKRRLRATQDYRDKLREKMKEILDEEEMDQMDNLINSFVDTIHEL